MGQLEEIANAIHEVTRLQHDIIERLERIERDQKTTPGAPVPYPVSPYPYSPYRPWYPQVWSSTTTNITGLTPQAEPKDTEHPADPGWHDDPEIEGSEDG